MSVLILNAVNILFCNYGLLVEYHKSQPNYVFEVYFFCSLIVSFVFLLKEIKNK